MVTEHIFDFEWRPLQNYLRDRDIAIPPFAADQESRSDALYNWIVSKGYSGKEGLNLGTYYHISDYGVIGLALLCAENVGDILKVIKGRRQKLSATPDLSGTVLPLCLIPNS
ncbi:hypothetical protein QOZ09_12035, partial [Pseudomonas aeruginosa]